MKKIDVFLESRNEKTFNFQLLNVVMFFHYKKKKKKNN